MSTWHYWECVDHDPPIRADGESGQHDYNRPTMIEDYAKRDLLVAAANDGLWENDRYRVNTQAFFREHPHCRLRIVTEYGDIYDPESGNDE